MLFGRLKECPDIDFDVFSSFVSGVATARYVQFDRMRHINVGFPKDVDDEWDGLSVQGIPSPAETVAQMNYSRQGDQYGAPRSMLQMLKTSPVVPKLYGRHRNKTPARADRTPYLLR